MMRIFAVSDIHIDYDDNWNYMTSLSAAYYADDILIIAGDISDNMEKLKRLFANLQPKFRDIFYVPGNHDLWVRLKEFPDSIAKFKAILALCLGVGIVIQPKHYIEHSLSIFPLFSWYIKHDEGPDSLYKPKVGEDKSLAMWADNYFTRWPSDLTDSGMVNDYFLQLNEEYLEPEYQAQNLSQKVISFSHFLPRQDLIFSTATERKQMGGDFPDPHPRFNFSSVAGSSSLDTQIRRLGCDIHIYGHQHRNRNRRIDGIQYISNCLGYPQERQSVNTVVSPVAADILQI
ncbi:MAG: metallophosphoesterase [Pseudomonadales bacterium]|nr:metallophosphoesterase [Pseudomonadales bacterium]